MAVTDGLTGLLAGAGEAKTEDDVVETGLEDRHQVVTRDALDLEGLLVVTVELVLQNAVDELGLLLLAQLTAILALVATLALGLTVGLLVDAHHDGVDVKGPAPLEDRRPIHCHISDPS